MDKWVAAQSTGPADQPETICIEILGGSFDGNPTYRPVQICGAGSVNQRLGLCSVSAD